MNPLWNKRKIYLFSLKEYIDELFNVESLPYNAPSLKTLKTNMSITQAFYIDLDNDFIARLWQEVYARYFDHAIISQYDELLSVNEFKKWYFKLISLMSRNADYYLTLLTNYSNSANQLMQDITTSTEYKNYFNDTPQNVNTSAVYEDLTHLTNFTKNISSTSSPLNTKIMRLKEIQDSYKRCYNDWVQEFERLFLEEEI